MRKIKLMALLLAVLMVVAAFAGCAGVKQEDLDAVKNDVAALEDLLKDQQDKNAASNDAILDALNKLTDKIEDVSGRVEDIETPEEGTTTTEADKAAKAEALASIEGLKKDFAKIEAQYDEEAYAAIVLALTTAQANVTAAATAAEVATIMAALDAALDAYKTYAMKLLDAYNALLGKLADEDAKANVAAAKDLIKIIDKVYGDELADAQKKDGDFAYLATEGSSKYINLYKSVNSLVSIFESKKAYTVTYDVDYVDAKGKIQTIGLPGLLAVKNEAKDIVEDITDTFGEEILFVNIKNIVDAHDDLQAEYEKYVEYATLVGGNALVDLITNADILVNAMAEIDHLNDAKVAYDKFNGRVTGTTDYKNLFATYEKLSNKVALAYEDDEALAWTKDVYAAVAADLADWADEYDLSAKNIEGIVGKALYEEFVINGKKVELIYEAYETFVADIVPAIEALNAIEVGDADAVAAFQALQEAVLEMKTLQEKSDAKEPEITDFDFDLTDEIFVQILVVSEIFGELDLEDEIYVDRLMSVGEIFDNADEDAAAANVVNLLTFAADVDALEADEEFDETARKAGEIYNFFANDYAKVKTFADAINAEIERLVKLVDGKKINSVREFIALEGKYIALDAEALEALDLADFESKDEYVYEIGTADIFVAIADLIDYDEFKKDEDTLEGEEDTLYFDINEADSERIYVGSNEDLLTIDFYNWAFPIFKDLINVDEFEAAKATVATRVNDLFAEVEKFVAAVEAIKYVKSEEGKTTYTFVDKNNNGKLDTNETAVEFAGNQVTLADAADVEAAYELYTAWALKGGNYNLEALVNVEVEEDDKTVVLADVFTFESLTTGDLGDAVATLNELRAEVKTLTDMAKAIAASADLIATVKNITVNNLKVGMKDAEDELAHYAYTGIVTKTEGTTTTYAAKYLVADAYGLKETKTEYKSSESAAQTAAKVTVTADALKIFADLYKAFVAMNNEYTFAYKTDDAIYYVDNGYSAYASVDTAKAAYDEYDLMMAKAAVLVAAADATDAAVAELETMVSAAKDFAALENAVALFNSRTDVTTGITADDITAWTIYAEFESIQ